MYGFEHVVPRARDGGHHAVGADGDDAVGVSERDRLIAQVAGCVRVHRLHDVADECLVLRPVGRESRLLVAAPDDHVGGRFDLGNLVAVGHVLVGREIQDAVARGAHRLPDREQHRVAEPAAREHDGLVRRNFGGRARRPHQHDRLAGLQQHAQIGRAAHLEHDRRDESLLAIDPRAGEREPFHREARAFDAARPRFEILQPIELPGPEAPCGERRTHDDFDDHRRQSLDLVHGRAQLVVELSEEQRIGLGGSRLDLCEHAAHERIALLRRAHRFHDVAEKRRMHVAEIAHAAAVGARSKAARALRSASISPFSG